jgi:hypothetical protein
MWRRKRQRPEIVESRGGRWRRLPAGNVDRVASQRPSHVGDGFGEIGQVIDGNLVSLEAQEKRLSRISGGGLSSHAQHTLGRADRHSIT